MATPRKRSSASGSGRSTTRETTRRARSPELDDPLYVPRLDRLVLAPGLEGADGGLGPDYSAILESICGVADDSQPVEQYDGTLGVTQGFVNDHQLPAVQVQWNDNLASVFTNPGNVNGVRWGSATMIAADLLLTCGHLFDQDPNGWVIPRQNGTNQPISPQDVALNMHINFQYQVDSSGTLRAEQRFAITQLIEYRLGGLDMAVCRIAGNPGTTYGWTEVSTTDAAVNDMLAIIGHPAGQPKRIEAGPTTSVSNNTIRYNDIDTLGGNSGSGILQASTGRLVGVHTNGGCNVQGTGTNSGTAIASIRAVSPTLQALPQGGATAQLADSILTNPSADIHATFLLADTQRSADTTRLADVVATAFVDDVATVRLADTSRLADVLGTPFAVDTGRADILGTDLAGDVLTIAGDDPNNTRREVVVDPGSIVVDPPFLGGGVLGGGFRPFVQAGPSQVVGREGVEDESLLEALDEALAVAQGALQQLEVVVTSVRAAVRGR